MKRSLALMCILCTGFFSHAQSGIVSTRKANDASGKLLTMEEAILSKELSPENLWCRWESPSRLLMRKEGKWQVMDIKTGICEDYKGGITPARAFTEGQSLFIRKADGSKAPVAESESSEITYGQFVSRNEFGIDGGIFWSPDSTKLAFYKKDESRVTSFPLLDITTRTGSLKAIKYPMAGMESENVQLGIYDIATEKTVYVKENAFGYDRYLTNVSWSPDASHIFIQVLDRSQKHLRLNMYDSSTGELIKTILSEDNSKYVEPQDPIWFIKGHDNLFIYRTDNRDGYRNLYLCDIDGNVRRLTETDADVAYVANDGKHVWYTSAEISPVENHLFRISISVPKSAATKGAAAVKTGKPVRLTQTEGWHEIAMNQDCSRYTDTWSSLSTPRVTDLCTSEGKVLRNLLTAEDPTLGYSYSEISLGTVKSADGKYDNWYRLIKPKDFDPEKKYPVIVYVYGGPHSQMVRNTFMAELRRWEMYMAQRGYIVYVQDNRGTSNRGADFEKAIHGQCGQAEMADQMEGVKMLMELPYVDCGRIGVHGIGRAHV